MLVGAQVVDPELARPWFFLREFAVEGEDVRLLPVRLGPLGVEDPGGQAYPNRLRVGLVLPAACVGKLPKNFRLLVGCAI